MLLFLLCCSDLDIGLSKCCSIYLIGPLLTPDIQSYLDNLLALILQCTLDGNVMRLFGSGLTFFF